MLSLLVKHCRSQGRSVQIVDRMDSSDTKDRPLDNTKDRPLDDTESMNKLPLLIPLLEKRRKAYSMAIHQLIPSSSVAGSSDPVASVMVDVKEFFSAHGYSQLFSIIDKDDSAMECSVESKDVHSDKSINWNPSSCILTSITKSFYPASTATSMLTTKRRPSCNPAKQSSTSIGQSSKTACIDALTQGFQQRISWILGIQCL